MTARVLVVDGAADSVSITVRLVSPNGGRTGTPPGFIVERTERFTDRSRRAAIASPRTPRNARGKPPLRSVLASEDTNAASLRRR
jgi:hypothetical protein